MTGASFIIMYKNPPDPSKAADVLKFFDWALKKGGKMAEELEYVPMPAAVVKLIQESWKQNIKTANKQSVWK